MFFKALKQNLRVKTFVGTSANALHIQIWTALIALLLLKYLQLKSTFGWSLSNLVALLRMNLFVYRDLWTWLNEPFTAPPLPGRSASGGLRVGLTGTASQGVDLCPSGAARILARIRPLVSRHRANLDSSDW